MRRRRGLWLLLAVVLLGLSAALMLSGQGEPEAPEPRRVEFPRRMRHSDWQRAERRRTQVVQAPGPQGTAAPQLRDPLLEALPRGQGRTALILEANAMRHSPLGELLLECLMRRSQGEALKRLRERTGLDPLEDLDRLAFADKAVILSGHFGEARFQELLADRASADYGERGRVFEPRTAQLPDGGVRRGRDPAIGLWGDSMLVVGETADEVKATLDRVEGRGPQEPPALEESATYGEMYGVVSAEQLARFFPPEQRELAERLKQVAQQAELHMDVRSDLSMVMEVQGADEAQVADLAKSLGGALSLARLQASNGSEQELAELLDFARVRPQGNAFKLELAVPLEFFRERLSLCGQELGTQGEADGGEPALRSPDPER